MEIVKLTCTENNRTLHASVLKKSARFLEVVVENKVIGVGGIVTDSRLQIFNILGRIPKALAMCCFPTLDRRLTGVI